MAELISKNRCFRRAASALF